MKKEESKNLVKKNLFFGWNNIKWGIKELIYIYSSKDSFFSKKRIESGIAFLIMQFGMVFYFIEKHQSMDIWDLVVWASVEGIICGYTINKIQSEKKIMSNNENEEN